MEHDLVVNPDGTIKPFHFNPLIIGPYGLIMPYESLEKIKKELFLPLDK